MVRAKFKPIQKKSRICTRYIKGKRYIAISTGEIVINKYATSGKLNNREQAVVWLV